MINPFQKSLRTTGHLGLHYFWKDNITTNTSCYFRLAHLPFPVGVNCFEDFKHRLQIIGGGCGYFRWKEVTSVVDSSNISATRDEMHPCSACPRLHFPIPLPLPAIPRFLSKSSRSEETSSLGMVCFNGPEPLNILKTLDFAGFLLRHQSHIDGVHFKDILVRTARRLQSRLAGQFLTFRKLLR